MLSLERIVLTECFKDFLVPHFVSVCGKVETVRRVETRNILTEQIIRAGAFNRDMAGALGINIKLIHAVVFALGVTLAAVAGMIAAPIASVYPNMGSQVLIMCFVVVVIGGIGSVRGALISALLVGLVDTFGKVLLPQVAGMLVYMLMAAVLLWKPEGLFKQ